jgi:DNA-binding NarL/FixJ family response regulator
MATTSAATPPGLSPVALLIGEDAEVESALAGLLNPEGWRMQKASNTDEAFTLAKSTAFDLVITGRHTSGRDDVAFLRRIRGLRPHTRMIILADESTPADAVASMREYAFAYLSKSFSMAALREVLQMALDSPAWDDGIEIISVTSQSIKLHVRCEKQTADRLFHFTKEVADLDMSEDDRRHVGTAFREMLLNAMEHGGHYDPAKYVEISYLRTGHMVMCRIKDPGQGFSLKEMHHAAINNPPGDPAAHVAVREQLGMRDGGFGIMFAKNMVDDLIYSEEGNEVTLVKYLQPVS